MQPPEAFEVVNAHALLAALDLDGGAVFGLHDLVLEVGHGERSGWRVSRACSLWFYACRGTTKRSLERRIALGARLEPSCERRKETLTTQESKRLSLSFSLSLSFQDERGDGLQRTQTRTAARDRGRSSRVAFRLGHRQVLSIGRWRVAEFGRTQGGGGRDGSSSERGASE